MRRFLILLVSALAFTAQSASAFDQPGFPRTANYFIGGKQNYEDPAVQQQLAKFNFSIITIFPGWDIAHGTTIDQVTKNIKAINPNSLVFPYLLMNSTQSGASAFTELKDKLNQMQWWLYPVGSSGTPVSDQWAGNYSINPTMYTPPDANGDRWVDWYAKWAAKKYYVPNPSIDGFYTDAVYWKPFDIGDYNRDGITDSIGGTVQDAVTGQWSFNYTPAQQWVRQGFAHYFQVLKSQTPGKYQIGNLGGFGDSNAVLTEYDGVLNGGLVEGIIGYSWSVESWGGWAEMMRWYRKAAAATAAPNLVAFHQVGSTTDYQGMRYGLASCLMDNGYYAFSYNPTGSTAAPYGDAPRFDEYDANLGQATSSPATVAWQNGVYRRDFENGIALVNPKGNGTRTVTLETDFKKLSGTQAASVNNGATVRTITLQDRDGIILKRIGTVAKPTAPTKVSVQ